MEEHKPTGREIELGPRPERTEEPGPRDIVITPPVAEGMVLIPAGEFVMGSDGGDYNEKPQRKVYLDAYYIDIYPVTNARFREFVRETEYKAQRGWEGYAKPGCDDHPVVAVTWYDAVEYCNWRSDRERIERAYDKSYNLTTGSPGYRLPAEAEWEKAARRTDGCIYPWGNDWDPKRCNCWDSGPHTTTPVGNYALGVSPYGCHDMAGNVWEWCHDWYDKDYYRHAPNQGSWAWWYWYSERSPSSSAYRVLRGGSWLDSRLFVRCSSRIGYDPEHRWGNVGFRCCRPA